MDYDAMEQYWIWLSSVEGIGPKRFYQLLSEYEDARDVWDNVGPQMKFLGDRAYRNLMEARSGSYFYRLFDELQRKNIAAITRLSQHYPPRLAHITDPPPTLYVRGSLELQEDKMISIVGSRRATRDGRRAALEIAEGLSERGVCVISGLARGIDSEAHQGCVNQHGRTIAVLGCGVDVVYPPENAALEEKILGSGGSIISDYAPGTPPLAQYFPARNRIISGLGEGVLIVEGDDRSGAMITANYALEQGKDIFVVPGSIYAPLSILPNKLLLDGAIPAISPWEILEYYRWADRAEAVKKKTVVHELDDDEQKIVEAARNEERSFDELVMVTGIGSQKLNSLLTMLELRGIIDKAPGRIYRAR